MLRIQPRRVMRDDPHLARVDHVHPVACGFGRVKQVGHVRRGSGEHTGPVVGVHPRTCGDRGGAPRRAGTSSGSCGRRVRGVPGQRPRAGTAAGQRQRHRGQQGQPPGQPGGGTGHGPLGR